MHPHHTDIGLGIARDRPPLPTAVAQWHGDRRIARRTTRQRRYARIVHGIRPEAATPAGRDL